MTPILLPIDNPHELLDVVCTTCKQRLIESREEIHRRGWVVIERSDAYWRERLPPEYFCAECFDETEEDDSDIDDFWD